MRSRRPILRRSCSQCSTILLFASSWPHAPSSALMRSIAGTRLRRSTKSCSRNSPRALEAQDAEESWTDDERRALSAHIEEGYLQAERGVLTDGTQADREIQAMKDGWRKEHSA